MAETKSSTAGIKENVINLGESIRGALNTSVDEVTANFSEYYEKGKTGVKEVEKNVEDKIKRYPISSILISVVVGFVVGLTCNKSITIQKG